MLSAILRRCVRHSSPARMLVAVSVAVVFGFCEVVASEDTGSPGGFMVQYVCPKGLPRACYIVGEPAETPHIGWAKRWKWGRPRVLFIAPFLYARDVVELAQRMDMDYGILMTGVWSRFAWFWAKGEYYHSYKGFLKSLRLKLREQWDALVICAGNPPFLFPTDVQAEIERKVAQGMGLVSVGNWDNEEARKIVARGERKAYPAERLSRLLCLSQISRADRGRLRAEGSHFISEGAPLEGLPSVWFWRYKRAEGKVVARSRGAPVIMVRKLGHGRVVSFGWRSYALMPQVADGAESIVATERTDAREGFWALLARAVLWAAKCEPRGEFTTRLSATKVKRGERLWLEVAVQFDEEVRPPRTGRIHFALNDTPGQWRIRVTDALTGVKAEAETTLTGAERS